MARSPHLWCNLSVNKGKINRDLSREAWMDTVRNFEWFIMLPGTSPTEGALGKKIYVTILSQSGKENGNSEDVATGGSSTPRSNVGFLVWGVLGGWVWGGGLVRQPNLGEKVALEPWRGEVSE